MGSTLCPPAPLEEEYCSDSDGLPLDIDEFQPGLYRAIPEKLVVRDGVDASNSKKLGELQQDALLDIVKVVMFEHEDPQKERLRGELKEGGWISMYYPMGEYFFVVQEDIHKSLINKFSKDSVSLDFEKKVIDSEEELYDDDQPYEDDMHQIEESDEPLDDIDDRPSEPDQQAINTEDLQSVSPNISAQDSPDLKTPATPI